MERYLAGLRRLSSARRPPLDTSARSPGARSAPSGHCGTLGSTSFCRRHSRSPQSGFVPAHGATRTILCPSSFTRSAQSGNMGVMRSGHGILSPSVIGGLLAAGCSSSGPSAAPPASSKSTSTTVSGLSVSRLWRRVHARCSPASQRRYCTVEDGLRTTESECHRRYRCHRLGRGPTDLCPSVDCLQIQRSNASGIHPVRRAEPHRSHGVIRW